MMTRSPAAAANSRWWGGDDGRSTHRREQAVLDRTRAYMISVALVILSIL